MVSNHLHHNHHWNRDGENSEMFMGVRLCERQWHCLDLRQLWIRFLAVIIIIIIIVIIVITTFVTLIKIIVT